MLTCDIHFCPLCDGAINPEHLAEIEVADYPYVVTRLLCEFCKQGWEAVWIKEAGSRRLIGRASYAARANPIDYGKFCQRLESTLVNRALVRSTIRDIAKVAVA